MVLFVILIIACAVMGIISGAVKRLIYGIIEAILVVLTVIVAFAVFGVADLLGIVILLI